MCAIFFLRVVQCLLDIKCFVVTCARNMSAEIQTPPIHVVDRSPDIYWWNRQIISFLLRGGPTYVFSPLLLVQVKPVVGRHQARIKVLRPFNNHQDQPKYQPLPHSPQEVTVFVFPFWFRLANSQKTCFRLFEFKRTFSSFKYHMFQRLLRLFLPPSTWLISHEGLMPLPLCRQMWSFYSKLPIFCGV